MHDNFINFLLAHWELSLAFIIVLFYWIAAEIMEMRSTLGITPSQLVHLMNRENAVVIDVREASLFEKSHILGAKNFPEKTLFDKLSLLKKHTSHPIVLVDMQGTQASKIIHKFISQGFEKAHYLKGGLQAWNQEKLPLESNPNKELTVRKGGKHHGNR